MVYETGKIDFTSTQSSKAVTFSGEYATEPTVTATAGESSADLNIVISDITRTGFTMLLSDEPGTTVTISYIAFGE